MSRDKPRGSFRFASKIIRDNSFNFIGVQFLLCGNNKGVILHEDSVPP